jgi:hypothetical protein
MFAPLAFRSAARMFALGRARSGASALSYAASVFRTTRSGRYGVGRSDESAARVVAPGVPSSSAMMRFTVGSQPPQHALAPVSALTTSSVLAPSRMQARMVRSVTARQWQTITTLEP